MGYQLVAALVGEVAVGESCCRTRIALGLMALCPAAPAGPVGTMLLERPKPYCSQSRVIPCQVPKASMYSTRSHAPWPALRLVEFAGLVVISPSNGQDFQ